MREWRNRQSPEKKKQLAQHYKKWLKEQSTDKQLDYNLKRYGISLEIYEQMLKEQNNVCKICKQSEDRIDNRTKKPRRLAVDHCHDTGKVRGLLCGYCNSALGMTNDNIEVLQEMIKYIQESKD